MLNSTATVMSEAVVAAAVRDGGKRVGNGESAALKSRSVGTGTGLSVTDAPSRIGAGVQTTPSVNGAAEMNKLKSELAAKNAQLQQMDVKLEEYKANLVKVKMVSKVKFWCCRRCCDEMRCAARYLPWVVMSKSSLCLLVRARAEDERHDCFVLLAGRHCTEFVGRIGCFDEQACLSSPVRP